MWRYAGRCGPLTSDHPVFDGIATVAGRIGAGGDRLADARAVVGMDTRFEDGLVDRRVRRQSPHRPHPLVPVQGVRSRIPGIDAQADQVGCGAQPCGRTPDLLLDRAALAGVSRYADHQFDGPVASEHRAPEICEIGSVPRRTFVENLVLDRRPFGEDAIDVIVQVPGKRRRIIQCGEGLAAHLACRQAEQGQHGGIGVDEAPLPIERIDVIGNRRQRRLEEPCLAGELGAGRRDPLGGALQVVDLLHHDDRSARLRFLSP
nr:hypothetical protein [Sphingomonas sp. GV3]